jgi:prenyltransferase beta subunit
LRATNGAARAWKYLGGDNPGATLPNKDRHAAFVLSCYDPKTGGFAEPGGKPDVTITSIGVMAAAELGIAHQKYARAMDYLKENAKTFEEVRIGAAAVEAWGVKECPFKLDEWFRIGKAFGTRPVRDAKDDARDCGSLTAMWLRLGNTLEEMQREVIVSEVLKPGQREDGGWGKKGENASDIETTYRVMRALMLLKEKPREAQKLRAYIEAHRNKDGGYATKPGDPSSMSGVYYCAIVSKWLNEPDGAKR